MNARDAIAITVHKQKAKLSIDERVAVLAVLALVFALLAGALHPQPQVTSCYQQTQPRP